MHLWQEEKIWSKSLSRSVMEMGREEGTGRCPGEFYQHWAATGGSWWGCGVLAGLLASTASVVPQSATARQSDRHPKPSHLLEARSLEIPCN